MQLSNVTFRGPTIDDPTVLPLLPDNLRGLLEALNGFVQFHGGLHVRGACLAPEWHSLRVAMEGDLALHRMYSRVLVSDVPFAQDCVGDQFLLREGKVLRLVAETGDVEHVASGLAAFLESANADPVEYLSLQPLLKLHDEGGVLEPGMLIHVYPPFCTKEAANGISVRAVPAREVILFHAELASKLPGEGGQIQIEVGD